MVMLFVIVKNWKKIMYSLLYFGLYGNYFKRFLEVWKNLLEKIFWVKDFFLLESG